MSKKKLKVDKTKLTDEEMRVNNFQVSKKQDKKNKNTQVV